MTLFLGARWFHDLLHGSMVHTWFIMIHYFMYHASSSVSSKQKMTLFWHLAIWPSPPFSLQNPLSHRRWNAKTVGKHATLPPWDCDKNEGKGCKLVNGWTPRIFQIFQVLPDFWSTQGPEWFQRCVLMAILSPTNYGSSGKNRTRTKQDALHWDARLGKFVVFFHWTMTLEGFGPKSGCCFEHGAKRCPSVPGRNSNEHEKHCHSSNKKHGFADPSEIVIWQQRPRKWLLLKPVSYSCEGHIGPSTKRNKRHKSLFDNKCHGVAIDLVWICLEGIVKNI